MDAYNDFVGQDGKKFDQYRCVMRHFDFKDRLKR
jgi:hypothetical protein